MNFTQEEARQYLQEHQLMPYVQGGAENQLPPDWCDLAHLHYLARKRKSFTILEFGVGRSTVILADALRQNKRVWDSLQNRPNIRNTAPFKVFSVDASHEWINNTKGRLPDVLAAHVEFYYSRVEVGTFNGRMCHFFEDIPDVVPDFIYLDGPAPWDAQGAVRGLSWKNPDRTVMAADILVMEPTLLPGTFVLVDGRTNNARFLERNLQRNWEIQHYKKEDITTMELREPPLGQANKTQIAYCLGQDFLGGR